MSRALSVTTQDGTRLNARIDGPEAAPWVVFSNSVLTDLSVWDDQIAALTDRYRILRYDQRGHGASEVTARPLDFTVYGGDLIAVMDAAGAARATLVGLSMGCPTALAAAAAAPSRITAFVAVDGVVKSAAGREAFWAAQRESARTQGMQSLATATTTRWLPGVDNADPRAQRLSRMIAATPVEGFAAATHALAAYDQSPAVPLTCPVLAIAGENDGAMPGTMRGQFGAFPDARIAIIPGAGHLPNLQNPDAFNTTLVGFLDANAFANDKETA
ncbi:alpha/beta fold hydrolase [Phaeovulum sp. W22_SRMD_FR3]|uniref:alpha/beta fold hydrolase n=1 Tax=Phaeovulum sp. W22_SRMD_FR3 TaxID=3240274 RepID=UPI003F96D3D1